MQLDREFARKMCEDVGIEWNDHALLPTTNGNPCDENSIEALFRSETTLYTTDISKVFRFFSNKRNK